MTTTRVQTALLAVIATVLVAHGLFTVLPPEYECYLTPERADCTVFWGPLAVPWPRALVPR